MRGEGAGARSPLPPIRRTGVRVTVTATASRRLGGASGQRRLVLESVRLACGIAANRYEARPVTAPITLIRSKDERHPTHELADQYGSLTPDLRDYEVDTGHGHMLEEPGVGPVAQAIAEQLESVSQT